MFGTGLFAPFYQRSIATAPLAEAVQSHAAKIADIQLLRAAAILLVLFIHLSLPTTALNAIGLQNPGWIGVELFFVISGYVVTQSLHRSDWNLPAFAVRRFFRLYPLLVAFAITCLVFNAIADHIGPDFIRPLFVIPTETMLRQTTAVLLWDFPNSSGHGYQTGAMWSMTREFHFYALLGLVIAAVALLIRRAATAILIISATVIVLGLTGRVWSYFAPPPTPLQEVYTRFLDLMSLGVFAALLPSRITSTLARITRPLSAPIAAIPLILFAFVPSPLSPSPALQPALALSGLCFVLLVIIASETGFGALPKWLRNWGDIIGDRSYAIYVFHFPVLLMNWYLAYHINPSIPAGAWNWPLWQVAIFAITMPPIVELLYRFVELPWITRGKSASRVMAAYFNSRRILASTLPPPPLSLEEAPIGQPRSKLVARERQ